MNSIKIEKGAIEALKKAVRLHDKMDELLQSNDKEPAWDGDIILYSDDDLKNENILYKIPTQVKGKNDEELLNRNGITYPVAYKNLRNYFNDRGVCYFVIVISDDGEKMAIFYNALTPVKLKSLLKGTEGKKPEQTRNIALNRLKNNDKNELFRILLQFGHESKEQGAGELVRKSISLEDMGKIDSIKTTIFASDNKDMFQKMANGETCWFGHLTNADIWVPFDYDAQKQLEFVECLEINEPFKIDGKPYYDSCEIRENRDKTFSIKLSENLTIETGKGKFDFHPLTELDEIIKDVQFLEDIPYGKVFYIGEYKICEYKDVTFNDKFCRMLNEFKQLQLAVNKFEIRLNKCMKDFTEDDWKAINELLKIYQGEIPVKNKNIWYMWWWQGKVVPFFFAYGRNGESCIESGIRFKHLKLSVGPEDEKYFVPVFIIFRRDVWEKLYDVDEKVLLEELEKGEFNAITEADFTELFIEILSAYDTTKNEKYYNTAEFICDKLMEINPDAVHLKLNRLQLIRRKREFTEDELQELEELESDTNDKKVVCAVNILLENKRRAKKELDEMSKEDKEVFMSYPIYNLL